MNKAVNKEEHFLIECTDTGTSFAHPYLSLHHRVLEVYAHVKEWVGVAGIRLYLQVSADGENWIDIKDEKILINNTNKSTVFVMKHERNLGMYVRIKHQLIRDSSGDECRGVAYCSLIFKN